MIERSETTDDLARKLRSVLAELTARQVGMRAMTTALLNMKTAVFIGTDGALNRRFLQMCSHYLVEPTACTPVAGWEEGQVENQVGLVRERFFTPRLRFKTVTR